jgi:hypothetical protein
MHPGEGEEHQIRKRPVPVALVVVQNIVRFLEEPMYPAKDSAGVIRNMSSHMDLLVGAAVLFMAMILTSDIAKAGPVVRIRSLEKPLGMRAGEDLVPHHPEPEPQVELAGEAEEEI